VHAAGGWGLPYGGYWGGGYGCHGGHGGGYATPAFGGHGPGLLGPSTDRTIDSKDKSKDGNGTKDKDDPDADDKAKDKDKGKDKKIEKGKDKEIEKNKDKDKDDTRAHLIFELPAGAKLFVDDQPIANAEGRKSFRTPALRDGQTYYYELRAEVVRDGKTVVQTKRVTLSAGDTIKADFSTLGRESGVAAAGSR
jgi:uncharacterized protein (TIGR03000 family)